MEYPGAIYHPPIFGFVATSVMNRGDRREPVFREPVSHLASSFETFAKHGAALGALASSRRIIEETTTRRQDAGAHGKFCRGLHLRPLAAFLTSTPLWVFAKTVPMKRLLIPSVAEQGTAQFNLIPNA